MDKLFLQFRKIALLSVALAGFVALTARPSAAAITTNSTTPFSGSFTNACNGHLMDFTFLGHLVASTTFDASSGFQTKVHFNEEQGRDVDTVTGVVCTDMASISEQGHN